MPLRAAELEVLYTANTADVAKGEKTVKDSAQRIESKPVTQKIEGNPSAALADLDRVATAAKTLVSERAVLQLDAEVARAEKALERAQNKVEDLQIRGNAGFEVTADTKRAEAALRRAEQQLERFVATRATVDIDASTVKAEAALDGFTKKAGAAGSEAGESAGDGVETSLIAALTAIPIAGGITLAGVAIGKAVIGAVQDGLQQEVGFDRLEALTGISPAAALRVGRAAGEAYANVFGDSIEANMDTARLALQFRIIDGDTSSKQAQKTIEGLAGIADVLDEDVRPTANAVATLLRTGLVGSAQQAFDVLAAGARNGVNAQEDLLETMTEYAPLFQRLGLSAEEGLGLVSQGLRAGARNSDLAGDALKEFQIRATDASKASAEGFESLGLNAEEMTAKIAAGGEGAREGLAQVLTALRETEDPVLRNAAAVALFGTQAEDLGQALFAMDLSNAVDQLDGVQGSAQRMFDTLADNDATKMEQASRNIEVAMDGIKGALAAGFTEPLADVATFVSENRGPVLQFFLDMANGALDFGETIVEGSASGTEALGDLIGSLSEVVYGLSAIPAALGDKETSNALVDIANGMLDFSETSDVAADAIRTNLNGAIDTAREKVNGFGEDAVNLGYLNDASLRLADSLSQVGVDGEGAALSMEGLDLANRGASDTGKLLEQQILNAAAALEKELAAAQATGDGQSELTERYNTTRDALIGQIEQMGIGRDAAAALIDEVLRTPESKSTAYSSNAPEQQGLVQNLATRIETLPDGSVVIRADTSPAEWSLTDWISKTQGRLVTVGVQSTPVGTGTVLKQGYYGGVVDFMARGGIPDLTPMASVASVISPNTWRVVGDRGDVAESFIPLDGSARSLAILAETIRRMPGLDAGGSAPAQQAKPVLQVVNNGGTYYSYDPTDVARAQREQLQRALDAVGL